MWQTEACSCCRDNCLAWLAGKHGLVAILVSRITPEILNRGDSATGGCEFMDLVVVSESVELVSCSGFGSRGPGLRVLMLLHLGLGLLLREAIRFGAPE